MSKQNQTNKQEKNQAQGFIANPKVFKSEDEESLIHWLPGSMRIEMPVNFYKSILGVEFTRKGTPSETDETPRKKVYGFIAKPNVYLSRDGQYLIHRVLDIRICKPVNFYKSILGIEFNPKSKSSKVA